MRLRRSLRLLGRIVSWVVIALIAIVAVVTVLVPRLGGATPYVVLTGSMEPSLPPGSVVVMRPVSMDSLAVGDVITYQVRSGDPTVVTHRIVSVGRDGEGNVVLRTQGDANDRPDSDPVREVQLKGRLWYHVPWVGHVTNAFSPTFREWALRLTIVGLFGYAAFMFVSAVRDRRRGRRQEVGA